MLHSVIVIELLRLAFGASSKMLSSCISTNTLILCDLLKYTAVDWAHRQNVDNTVDKPNILLRLIGIRLIERLRNGANDQAEKNFTMIQMEIGRREQRIRTDGIDS